MSNRKNINTNVEKKDATAVAHEIKGELTYEDKVIKIIGLSLENVSGLLGIDGGFFSNLKEKIVNSDDVTSGVNVEVGKTQVAVDLNVIAEYQKMFQHIQKSEKSYLQKLLKWLTWKLLKST